MKILDMGLDKRIEEVAKLSSEDGFVMNAQNDFDKYFNLLTEKFGNCNELLWLEDSVNRMRYAELEAGYRVGLSDGMQLQQEVNAILKGGVA